MGGVSTDANVEHGTVVTTSSGTTIETGLDTIDIFVWQRQLSGSVIDGLYIRADTNMPNSYVTNVITDPAQSCYRNYMSINGGNVTIPKDMTGTGYTLSWCAIQFI